MAPSAGLDEAIDRLARPILAAGPRAIRLQKPLILDWEELPTGAAIERGIDAFVTLSTATSRRGWRGPLSPGSMRESRDIAGHPAAQTAAAACRYGDGIMTAN